ncbi:hypothetical protein BMS3Abin05_00608 [bacterium BMS3Abin05]|nr:hypothetical protein BMS3Abin05_00608 [bacterium BMS3Abin05]GBE28280.1 hypothetical protein BMS3Bbin03_02219 [bacterium BMS3Bbin03]HDK35721.1 hypothetical protein [Bacteroidota bacterium]
MSILPLALWGGFVASVVWFILGGALYMNPFTAKIYHNAENAPALKKWPGVPKYLGLMYLSSLIECILAAIVYLVMKSVLPVGPIPRGLAFGLVLIAVRIVPRFLDMWMQTTYPNRLLWIEGINGSIGSFIIALTYAYVI